MITPQLSTFATMTTHRFDLWPFVNKVLHILNELLHEKHENIPGRIIFTKVQFTNISSHKSSFHKSSFHKKFISQKLYKLKVT